MRCRLRTLRSRLGTEPERVIELTVPHEMVLLIDEASGSRTYFAASLIVRTAGGYIDEVVYDER